MPHDSPSASALIDASRAEAGGDVIEAFPAKLNDVGNGQRFVMQHGHNVRYCGEWGDDGWLAWYVPPDHPSGGWWKRDRVGAVIQLGKETAVGIASEQSLPPGEMSKTEWRGHLTKWSHDSQSSGRLRSMLGMAESEPPIAVTADVFDVDPWLFNFTNGTMDLRTGEFRPAAREDLITKVANTHYDASAEAPTWRTFLDLVQPERSEQSFLQRAVVYSMTGLTVYPEVFFALCGGAGTGKSTFTDTILELFGDYGKVMPSFMLLQQRGGEDRKNEIAWIRDARIAVAGETEEKAKLSISTIKSLTGGDRLVGRNLHEQYRQSKAIHKLWLHTNYEPDPGVNDIGFFDRLKLVRFDRRIRGDSVLNELCGQRNIKEVLAEELPGIANWALEGLPQWRDKGLGDTQAVIEAVRRLQAEADRLGAFLAERMVKEATAEISIKECFAEWKLYCEESNVAPRDVGGVITFGRRLKELGFTQPDNPKGGKVRVWAGLRKRMHGEGAENETPASSMKQWKHPSGDDGLFE